MEYHIFIGGIQVMFMLQPSGGVNMDFNTSNPIHLADSYSGIKKIRTGVCITLSRIKDLYFVALRGQQSLLMEVLILPEVV